MKFLAAYLIACVIFTTLYVGFWSLANWLAARRAQNGERR